MKFDLCLDELRDLKLPEAEWDLRVKWSYDPDYSPKEGLNDKYCFELQKFIEIVEDVVFTNKAQGGYIEDYARLFIRQVNFYELADLINDDLQTKNDQE